MDEQTQLKILKKIEQAKRDPIIFIDKFCYTFDPKRQPYHLPFSLFVFQKELVNDIRKAIEEGYDIFIEKCREMGATYTVVDVLLWFWMYIPGSNFKLGSRKEEYVDNTGGDATGISNKEESLFGKLEYTIKRLPQFMLPAGFNLKKHLTYMSLTNPENGNIISGESANPNFSRGGRQKAVLFDEFAFWDFGGSAWGSAGDTTNCRIILTTPGIKPSKAKRLREGLDGEKIKIVTLPYNLDPRKTQEWLTGQRERRSEEDFAREIMINWETSVTGKVYPEISQALIGAYPYNPLWPLFVSWDFGLDGVAMQYWQPNPTNAKMRLVDSYLNDNKPISFYFPLVGKPIDSIFTYTDDDLLAINATSKFKKAVHFGDPDVAKRSLLTGTSTRQALEAVGIYVQTKPESNDFASRREMTKVMFQKGPEINNTPRNLHYLECIKSARYPARQETSQATTSINLPIHDWTSHHRTATEYFAVNYEPPLDLAALQSQFPREEKFQDGFY